MSRRTLAVIVAVAGLAVLGVLQNIPHRHSIEDDLTARSLSALAERGLTGVEVDFAGRDGTVRTRTVDDRDRAREIVSRVEGVRVVHAEAMVTRLPAVTATIEANRLALSGAVPSEAVRTALVGAVAGRFGLAAVDDRLTIDPAVSETGLTGLDSVLLAIGPQPGTVTAELRDGVLTLTGTVPSAAVKDAAGQAARRTTATVQDRLQVLVPEPVGTPEPPATPAQVQARLVQLPPVTFQTNSATLTPQGVAVLVRAAAILAGNPTVRIRIEGHTDTIGSAARNLALSRARAEAVRTALAARGVAADRMTAVGFGETRLKVPDTSAANQAVNRRVEFVVLP